MEGKLRVTPEKLISAAGTFESSAGKVSNTTKQMMSIVDGLKTVWTGEAANNFNTTAHKLDDDIARLVGMIREHSNDLKAMGDAYKKADADSKSIQSRLKTDTIK